MAEKRAVIIGAGPAGLTAALDFLEKTEIVPVVIEKSEHIGGISMTVNYRGNRIDVGGHRFFSRSDRVMRWWLRIMPAPAMSEEERRAIFGDSDPPEMETGGDRGEEELVMLVRERRSRIYYLRKYFDYPVSLSLRTLSGLGLVRSVRIVLSYLRSRVFPFKDEENLEQFFTNRFGRELYRTFFKSYTEKVWGIPCEEISAEWGAQRVKGLSIGSVVLHLLKKLVPRDSGVRQKDTETSLIEKFLYPRYGPGQMWEEVARRVEEAGGRVMTGLEVDRVNLEGNRVISVEAVDRKTGERRAFEGDHFVSTMPVIDLARATGGDVPRQVAEVCEGLPYRDFIVVGLLLSRLRIEGDAGLPGAEVRDSWIYIQEPDVLVGRMQIFNNWSPYLVSDPSRYWIGLEYFCNETDEIWRKTDEEVISAAVEESSRIGLIDTGDVLDGTVIRMPKAYPAYFGTYERFDVAREYFDGLENLFLIGRNGMHRYNNQDHSMLTAMLAVENIVEGRTDRSNIWAVNLEQEYHEER